MKTKLTTVGLVLILAMAGIAYGAGPVFQVTENAISTPGP